jgi:tetratricopeptide (TPR) repeat protein
MSLDELLAQGRKSLAAQDYALATRLLREAARRAPMRADVRELLSMALQGNLDDTDAPPSSPPRASSTLAAFERRSRETPTPSRTPGRDPQYEDEAEVRGDSRENEETLDLDLTPEPPAPVREAPWSAPRPARANPAIAPRKPVAPHEEPPLHFGHHERALGQKPRMPARDHEKHKPVSFDKRHRRGPISALLLGAVTGLLAAALAGGAIWFYLHKARTPPPPGEPSSFSRAQLNSIMEKAAQYTQRGEYSLAIEQLKNLPPSPERNRMLAQTFMEQGDRCFIHDPPLLEGALEAYKEAVQFDEGNPQCGNALGMVYLKLAQAREGDAKAAGEFLALARQTCEAVLARQPGNLQALESLAKVAIAMRDAKLQADAYRRIIEAAPDSESAAIARRNLRSLGFKP